MDEQDDYQALAKTAPKVYVRFGPRPTQEVPIEWAEGMLSLWFERHQPQFSKILAEVAMSGGRQ